MSKFCDKCGLNEAEYMACEEPDCGSLVEIVKPQKAPMTMSEAKYTKEQLDELLVERNELRSALSEIVCSLDAHDNAFMWVNDRKTVDAFQRARDLLAKATP